MPFTEPAMVRSPAFSDLIGSAQRATGRSNHRSKHVGNSNSVREELVRERAILGRSDVQREVCSTGVSRTIRTLPYMQKMLSVETPATVDFHRGAGIRIPQVTTRGLSAAQHWPLQPLDTQS